MVLSESCVNWLNRCAEERTGHTKPHLTWFSQPSLQHLNAAWSQLFHFGTEWSLKTPNLDALPCEGLWKAYFWSCTTFFGDAFLKGIWLKTTMDQASGGEDPNKPSRKKSNEDEGKNKKLVGVLSKCCMEAEITVTPWNPTIIEKVAESFSALCKLKHLIRYKTACCRHRKFLLSDGWGWDIDVVLLLFNVSQHRAANSS